jgi:hypothetical protein
MITFGSVLKVLHASLSSHSVGIILRLSGCSAAVLMFP